MQEQSLHSMVFQQMNGGTGEGWWGQSEYRTRNRSGPAFCWWTRNRSGPAFCWCSPTETWGVRLCQHEDTVFIDEAR